MRYIPIDVPFSKKIGFCIFCGGPGTTRDHIVPEALGGRHTIANSSCEPCRDRLNREIDQPVLKRFLHAARLTYGVPRNRSRKPDKYLKLMVAPHEGGELEVLSLPLKFMPKRFMLPVFEGPYILENKTVNIQDPCILKNIFAHNILSESVYNTGGGCGLIPMIAVDDLILFMRMMAKSALTLAFLSLNKDEFEPIIMEFVNGNQHLSFLTGSMGMHDPQKNENKYYDLKIGYMGKYILASIQIFSHLKMPYYDFVVGIRKDYGI
ncbi:MULTISPECIES: HNH endonuclease [unclassified Novosphingobium]|uniref:HNH endonuclease n=1 Tax=unclassified Novosphingobium TaxID=2644732 RepID=UPI000D2FB8C0|nr:MULTISPECIES: HNH endonuclease [unclassified Novosphingobium]PTR05191.1 HNH endonuclease [Novosphingobium sp. GV055]PUA93755.1 HNH endonuclease [Novosphingobium sp. GV061]PUB10567.1 HNH endonuclease [Novosphingobium sp. GV079]PUB36458.1 HNH endonuclease [Novosphingobium sp. GV027]